MGMYNEITGNVVCPFCGIETISLFQFKAGIRDLTQYEIGQEVAWVPRKSVKNGGRPIDGDIDVLGCGECNSCGKFFWVTIEIRSDKLIGVKPVDV